MTEEGLLPPEGSDEEELVNKVFAILSKVVKDKVNNGVHSRFKKCYELGRNKHWDDGNTDIDLSSANFLFLHRQRTMNMLSDNNPTFDIRVYGEEGDDISTAMNRGSQHWWGETEQQEQYAKGLFNGETYGVAISKMYHDDEAESGEGEVLNDLVDAYCFGLYPVTCTEVQNAEAVLHFYPMEVAKVRRMAPEKADRITSDAEFLKDLGSTRRQIGGHGAKEAQRIDYGGTISMVYGSVDDSPGAMDEQTVICEMWLKDYCTEKYTEEEATEATDDLGRELNTFVEVEYEKPKYPGNIRVVTICTGGMVLIDDQANPSINPQLPDEIAKTTFLYDKFPFPSAQSIEDTSTFWSPSDFEQLEPLQMEIDICLTQLNMVKDYIARIEKVIPKDAGIDPDEADELPGILEPLSSMAAQGIKYLQAPTGNMADILAALNLYKDFMLQIAGTFDMDMAQSASTGQVAYKTIAALLERQNTMNRGKIRNYQRYIRDIGRMYISLAQNFFGERWISYDYNGDRISERIDWRKMLYPAKLSVVSGSTMPTSRIQLFEEAMELRKAGIIPPEEVLARIDWPNRKEIIEKMKAGPVGEMLGKLMVLLPQLKSGQLPQQLQKILTMDPKDFESAVKKGEISPIQLQDKGPDPRQQMAAKAEIDGKALENALKMEELKKTRQETAKIAAEAELTQQKAFTEIVSQNVKQAGLELDQEKLKIEKAEFVADVKNRTQEKASDLNTAGYRERGMKSNNKDI